MEKITTKTPVTSTAQIKDFLAMVHGSNQLDVRTTYSLADAVQLAEDGIIYEYSHIDKLGKKAITTVDSVTVSFSGTPLSQSDATSLYDSLLSKTSIVANAIPTDSLWLLGVELQIVSSTSTTAKIYIFGLFTDGTNENTTIDTTGLPAYYAGLYYAYIGVCENHSLNKDGAATYLQKYTIAQQGATPSSSGKRIGNLVYFQMESTNKAGFSQHLLDNCTELNPNDPTPGDGNMDSRSLYFDCDGSCTNVTNIYDVECITFQTGGELAYHQSQVPAIFSEERDYTHNDYLYAIRVKKFTGPTNNNTMRGWALSAFSYSLYSEDDPTPDPGDIREI